MRFSLIFILGLVFTSACSKSSNLKIATSANMQFAMEEIIEAFQEENDIEIDLIVNSSGKLAAQIEQGAPFDVLVAANMKYPQKLHDKGLTTGKPINYANGKLILWTTKNLDPSWEILTTKKVKKIAIPNPKTAPYGEAAVYFLKEINIYDKIKHKLVFGESISQTNLFISSKSVDFGLTSMSVIHSPHLLEKGHHYEADPAWYPEIKQGVVVLKNSKKIKMAEAFQEFLFSEKAQEILKKHGYSTEIIQHNKR